MPAPFSFRPNIKLVYPRCLGALVIAGSLLLSGRAQAAEAPDHPYQGSAEFERLKSLVGTWKARNDMGHGPAEITVVYRLVSGGSVLEERFFPGTPNEMVTMYHDKGGKLSLTHYCMLGNQPVMVLKSSDAKSISFDLDPTCGIDPKGEKHMHSLTLTFEKPDELVANWQLADPGQNQQEHPFKLRRVKA
jgi:hypothetical protein